MNKPDVKLNPNARMRYEITMTVKDAPGPFDRIEGRLLYRVSTSSCLPETSLVGRLAPKWREPVIMKHVAHNVYRTEIYADRLRDEDYFGLGICHWRMESLSLQLVTGSLSINPSIISNDIFNGSLITRYFTNESYADKSRSRIDIGADNPSHYKLPNDTFSVDLRATEVTL